MGGLEISGRESQKPVAQCRIVIPGGPHDSDSAGLIALNARGHLDQPPPGALDERHHAIHVAIARQWNLDTVAVGVDRFPSVDFWRRGVGPARLR
jgi:hypothetical protein